MKRIVVIMAGMLLLQCSTTTQQIASIKTDDGRKARLVFETSSHPFNDIAYNHRSQILAASSYHTIIVWDLGKGYIRHVIHIDYTAPRIAIDPRGKRLLTIEKISDKEYPRSIIRIWNLETGKYERALTENGANEKKNYKITALAFNGNGTLLAEADNKNTLRIWDFNSGTLVRKFKYHRRMVRTGFTKKKEVMMRAFALTFGPDGNTVYIGGNEISGETEEGYPLFDDPLVKAFDITAQKQTGETTFRTDPKSEYEECVRSVTVAPDNASLYVATSSSETTNAAIRKYDLNLKLSGVLKRNYQQMIIDDDGRRIFGYDEKTFYMLDTETRNQRVLRKGYDESLISLYRIPNTDNLLICGDTTAQVWNLGERKLIGLLYTKDTDWVAAANDGRFDGTKKALKCLRWKIGDENIPLDRFDTSFRTDGLIAYIFHSKEMKTTEIDVADQLVGKIRKITGDEIIVATGSKESELTIGQDVFCYVNKVKIRMKVTFPMMTLAKCRIADDAFAGKLSEGIPVFIEK